MNTLVKFCSALTVAIVTPVLCSASDFSEPTEPVLLTISGMIDASNGEEGTVRLDLPMLESFEPVVIETETIWTEGKQSFTGVSLAALMEAVGADGEKLMATAINDYSVEIPVEDWVEDGPIVAYLNNGEQMSVRDKGPLWVVYPYDSSPSYQSEVIYSRSIWQLDRLDVKE